MRLIDQDFRVAPEVFFKTEMQTCDGRGENVLFREWLIQQGGDSLAIFRRKCGDPMLLDRITFVAGKAVERFEMSDIRSHCCGKGRKNLSE